MCNLTILNLVSVTMLIFQLAESKTSVSKKLGNNINFFGDAYMRIPSDDDYVSFWCHNIFINGAICLQKCFAFVKLCKMAQVLTRHSSLSARLRRACQELVLCLPRKGGGGKPGHHGE